MSFFNKHPEPGNDDYCNNSSKSKKKKSKDKHKHVVEDAIPDDEELEAPKSKKKKSKRKSKDDEEASSTASTSMAVKNQNCGISINLNNSETNKSESFIDNIDKVNTSFEKHGNILNLQISFVLKGDDNLAETKKKILKQVQISNDVSINNCAKVEEEDTSVKSSLKKKKRKRSIDHEEVYEETPEVFVHHKKKKKKKNLAEETELEDLAEPVLVKKKKKKPKELEEKAVLEETVKSKKEEPANNVKTKKVSPKKKSRKSKQDPLVETILDEEKKLLYSKKKKKKKDKEESPDNSDATIIKTHKVSKKTSKALEEIFQKDVEIVEEFTQDSIDNSAIIVEDEVRTNVPKHEVIDYTDESQYLLECIEMNGDQCFDAAKFKNNHSSSQNQAIKIKTASKQDNFQTPLVPQQQQQQSSPKTLPSCSYASPACSPKIRVRKFDNDNTNISEIAPKTQTSAPNVRMFSDVKQEYLHNILGGQEQPLPNQTVTIDLKSLSDFIKSLQNNNVSRTAPVAQIPPRVEAVEVAREPVEEEPAEIERKPIVVLPTARAKRENESKATESISQESSSNSHLEEIASDSEYEADEISTIMDGFYLSAFEIHTLRTLKITIAFDLPTLHLLETRIFKEPTPTQQIQIQTLGIHVDDGPFSVDEDAKIKSNYRYFLQRNNLKVSNRTFSTRRYFKALPKQTRINFVRCIGRHLDSRTLHSIYKRFCTLFYAGFSSWSDEVVVNYIEHVRDKTAGFLHIAKIVNIIPSTMEPQYTELKQNAEYFSQLVYSVDFIDKFLDSLVEVTKSRNVYDLKRKSVSANAWNRISAKLDKQTRAIKIFWQETLYEKLFRNKSTKDPQFHEQLINFLIINKISSWDSVNWNNLESIFPGCESTQLQQLLLDLFTYYVPSTIKNNFHDSLLFMQQNVYTVRSLGQILFENR